MSSAPPEGGFLIEATALAGYVRVCAIDPATGMEAVAVGPIGAMRADLEAVAIRTLRRRIARLADQPSEAPAQHSTRPGLSV